MSKRSDQSFGESKNVGYGHLPTVFRAPSVSSENRGASIKRYQASYERTPAYFSDEYYNEPRERSNSVSSFMSKRSDQSFGESKNVGYGPRSTVFRAPSVSSENRGTSIKRYQASYERTPVNFSDEYCNEPRERSNSAYSFMSKRSDQSFGESKNVGYGHCSTVFRTASISSDNRGASIKRYQASYEPTPVNFSDEYCNKPRDKSGSSGPSYMSMRSDQSFGVPINFRDEDFSTEFGDQMETQNTEEQQLKSIFKELEEKVITLLKKVLQTFKVLLSPKDPASSESEMGEEEDQSDVRQGALKITLHVLRSMNQTDLANTLQNKILPSCHQKLKSNLKERFQKIHEGISGYGAVTFLNEIYTDLYITEGGSGEVNNEHEVRQIEAASRRRATPETPIKCNDLFKEKPIRSVLTKGVAGIGKTVSVQKFLLDWAEGKANQDVIFMFPLPFRELNLIKQEKFSLVDLLHHFFLETHEIKPSHYHEYRMLFIFDGLDECRLPLDFQNNVRVSDITESVSVDVLLTNLIKGNLLPSAHLWITTRPAAANQIPAEFVDRVTEVRGFSDPQKEEYFRKRISDQNLAKKIISHMKFSRSLYIMCYLPVFCWISATVLKRMLDKDESGKTPKTLTQMFTYFLIFQIKHRNQKYDGKSEIDLQQTKPTIMALGKLAFRQLDKGNLIFYEEDLRECGIDVREASVYSGVCTQIFREEFGLHQGKVFSFVHLSVQEFLAALYTFLCFFLKSKNVLQEKSTGILQSVRKSTTDFLKSAVDKTLTSENGHLDLFLRFLLGLSLESNQILLADLLPKRGSSSHSREKIVEYIKMKISEHLSPERSINLFHCLNELNDDSLVQEVQTYLNRGDNLSFSGASLSPSQWSALVFVLLNSEDDLEEFDLRKYNKSEECLLRLIPVVKASSKAVLQDCNLTQESCAALSSALGSNSSRLRDLDLSNNNLQNSGVKLLSTALQNQKCNLEKLQMECCRITDEGFGALVSALTSNPSSHLTELKLNQNNLGVRGVMLLSDLLQHPNCKLQKLQLYRCNLTEESCAALSSALSSNSSRLRDLNLSFNKLQDSGVKLLSSALQKQNCNLEKLWLSGCKIMEEGFADLAFALRSNPSSHLTELNLSYNKPEELGVELLSDLLKDPNCNLKILQLKGCSITDEGFVALASALRSNPSSHLTELNLLHNKTGKSGKKLLSDLLKDPNCNLKKLHIY